MSVIAPRRGPGYLARGWRVRRYVIMTEAWGSLLDGVEGRRGDTDVET
jgi:hypothetical protein